ncbi:hypothetical protein GCM10020254_56190 [Streptomyces goshikiensis]
MPRTVWRVVWGRLEVIATLVPTSALVRVDFPALGRPTKHAKPARCGAVGSGERSLIRAILPDAATSADQATARRAAGAASAVARPGRAACPTEALATAPGALTCTVTSAHSAAGGSAQGAESRTR